MRILLTGASGQLGRELQASSPEDVDLIPCDRRHLDITDRDQILRALDEHRPRAIINAAAYTAVDRAEQEQETAFAVNDRGAANLSRMAHERGVRMLHFSTDFVFSGEANQPYPPDAETAPQGVYGASKLAGEKRVLDLCGDQAVVIRTAWVYSRFGGNFVQTMLRLMSEQREIQVVMDQIGTPTWTQGLSGVLWAMLARPDLHGVYHWTDSGVASWYDFAIAIQEEALALNLLRESCRVVPVTSEDFPTPASRPHYSVLDTTRTCADLKMESIHWRRQLRAMLEETLELERE